MIKIIKEAQVRSEEDNRNLRETVAGIIGEVRGRGDAANSEWQNGRMHYEKSINGITGNQQGSRCSSRSWRI